MISTYPTIAQTCQLKEMIFRFNDYRLCELFQEILPYRRDNLQSEGYLTQVEQHLSNKISLQEKSNEELRCFYIFTEE